MAPARWEAKGPIREICSVTNDSKRASEPAGGHLGRGLSRFEDAGLLTGRGRFVDDIVLPGQLRAWFARSPYAHASFSRIDTAAALAAPGVVCVFTAADLERDGVKPLSESGSMTGRDGAPPVDAPRPILARDRVRHVGEAVAVVIADSVDHARDASELIDVDYAELPAVTDGAAALLDGAPPLWAGASDNVALDWEGGDRETTSRAFDAAHHVTRVALEVNRVYAACMETRGALGDYDLREERFTLQVPSQGVNHVRDQVARALGVAPSRVRVITSDVGGAFGIKIPAYPEYVLVAWAARRLGRPVKWTGDRSESFVSDGQCRDHRMVGELALDEQGRMLAIRSRVVSNMGAYTTSAALATPTTGGTRCLTGVYVIPTYHAETRVAFTNTVPVHAYRGAGKPEYIYLVERLVDTAARELGLDAAELRRRNLVSNRALPYTTPTGLEFDSGDFARNMEDALVLADRDGFAERRAAAQRAGRLRGFGFAVFQEPDAPMGNRVSLCFDPGGELTVTLTGQSGGQGHVTTFAQVAADCLGIGVEAVRLVQGDSDLVGPGAGTGGSGMATAAGGGIALASRQILEKGRRIAAHLLEASETDIEFDAGSFRISGTDRRVSFQEVLEAAFDPHALPDDCEPGLEAVSHYKAPAYSYPCGCHVCELEIDPATGVVSLESYTAVNDHGVVINPLLLEGQIHGGVVQGIGQALQEQLLYAGESGQLLTGSFMDYTLPRAADLPSFVLDRNETRCLTNPLGVKGVGESGCTASMPAVMNAVVDALAGFGVENVDMPATSEAVWRLCSPSPAS